jgi:nicotinate phosphoribosyltransferase
VTAEELDFLKKNCPYLTPQYLTFLSGFHLKPSKQLKLSFSPINDTGSEDDVGDFRIDTEGLWLDTILYEIPLLALVSEAYFKFVERDWSHEGQVEKAHQKGTALLSGGCIFSEFGTRRRRDYHTQDLVVQGLCRATEEARAQGWTGKLSGTSNVHFAHKHGLVPIGTVAHEWFMGVAAITDDYENANEIALRYWTATFGEGVLAVALTDTFGTPTFLKAFRKQIPNLTTAVAGGSATLASGAATTTPDAQSLATTQPPLNAGLDGAADRASKTYAEVFTGVRQDSGDPLEFVKTMRAFYDEQNIQEKKTIVFSDSLNLELCFKYKEAAEKAGFVASFGVGTFLTSKLSYPILSISFSSYRWGGGKLDVGSGNRTMLTKTLADDFTETSTGAKSTPLNIVIKIASASGRHAVKISDNIGKNTGDRETVQDVKRRLGYTEKEWEGGDEKTRWGGDAAAAQ